MTLKRTIQNEEQVIHQSRQPVKFRFKLLFSEYFSSIQEKNGERVKGACILEANITCSVLGGERVYYK